MIPDKSDREPFRRISDLSSTMHGKTAAQVAGQPAVQCSVVAAEQIDVPVL
jgi:hypothetical protein